MTATRERFVACLECGWEGINTDECPECGEPTKDLGEVIY